MSGIQIRKQILSIEKTFHEGGAVASRPLKIGVVANVIKNPFVGRHATGEELQAYAAKLAQRPEKMVERLKAMVGN